MSECGNNAKRTSIEGGDAACAFLASSPEAPEGYVRDATVTTAFSRAALRRGCIALKDTSYRDLGPGWALLADLDHFKKVNDYYGLPSGDIVLAQLADRLQRRFGDCVVRYAGEQFLVLWRGEDGLAVAEEMRAVIEAEPFALPEVDEPLKITISVGAARFDDVGEGIESALAALAKAKADGRNCVRG